MDYAYIKSVRMTRVFGLGGAIRAFTVSLLGAIVLAAGLVVIRNHKVEEQDKGKEIPPGETVRGEISLDRLREIGL